MSTLLQKLSKAAKAGTPGRLALKRGQILCYERLVNLRDSSEEPTVTTVDFDNKCRTLYCSEIAAVYGEAQPHREDAPARPWVRRMPGRAGKHA